MASETIIIKHVATNQEIEFEPYLTKFSDNFKSDWEQSYVIGRMDQIPTFKRTTRVINIGFDVPSSTMEVARENYEKSQKLASFLYPIYKNYDISLPEGKSEQVTSEDRLQLNTENMSEELIEYYRLEKQLTLLEAQTAAPVTQEIMAASPLIGIIFTNLINSGGDPTEYLYGYIDGYNFSPDLDMGMFIVDYEYLIPKAFKVEFNFTVIHTDKLGWDMNGFSRGGPYGI